MVTESRPPSVHETHPFVVERFQVEEKPNHRVPRARLLVTPVLRTSGLLASLTEDAARTLLGVVSHLTPNGWIRPAIQEVAEGLGIPVEQARDRICDLAALSLRGEQLVHLTLHESGLETVHPARTLVGEYEDLAAEPTPQATLHSSRDTVLATSRERYGTPRAEVERMVMAQLGHYPEETEGGPLGDVWRRLSALGVSADAIRALLEKHPLPEIVNQLDWLPLRGEIRNPARFVVAAVESRYTPPARVRLEQAIAIEEKMEERRPEHDEPDTEETESALDLPTLDSKLNLPEEARQETDVDGG